MEDTSVLTIAGFDPSSGAGVTADLMVFAAHGLFGTSCITALTVQNTLGVAATQMVATDTVVDTLNNLQADLPPAGIKIGMLGTASMVRSVAAFLARVRQEKPVIVLFDPVLKSSSGKNLLDCAGTEEVRNTLLQQVDWITPNVNELAVLTGYPVDTQADIQAAAAALQRPGTHLTVVVTGGHLDPPDDLLVDPSGVAQIFTGQRIETKSNHGTGCAFSSALLCRLILGDNPAAATLAAKRYVAEAMRSATARGSGAGPVNHLWPLR